MSGFFALREGLAILAERVKGHFILFVKTDPILFYVVFTMVYITEMSATALN